MSATLNVERFRTDLGYLLTETFEQVQGIFLDRGTSLFETLETISAEVAARPVSARCANLAAQVNHTRFYLDVMLEVLAGNEPKNIDWDGSWQVGPVTEESWADLKAGLRASYERIGPALDAVGDWNAEDKIGVALAMVVHSAYHLGEIRQATCTLLT